MLSIGRKSVVSRAIHRFPCTLLTSVALDGRNHAGRSSEKS
jgi:hypothetical protein